MKYLYGLLGTLAVLAIGIAVWLYDPLSNRLDETAVLTRAAGYDVEIIRDDWGVPHVFGVTDADTAFGTAYAHSEDDFETIQEFIAATRGNLSRYRGAGAAPTDYIVALLEVWETMDERYEADVPAKVKALATGYADGLNLYALHNPDQTWTGLAPFTPEDIVAGFIFKTPFFYGLDGTLAELFGSERDAGLALDPNENRQAFELSPNTMASERGSNAIAVSPERSGDGVTRLLINSHQPMTGPVAWYEVHMVSEEGLNITGGIFPGTPVILHGFNADLGWANTVSAQDLHDVFRLTVNPENSGEYRLDGEWVPFEETTATLAIKLFGPFAFKVNRPVKRSVHGPVIEAEHGIYALRYAGMGEIRQLEQYYALNHSRSLERFMSAMAINALPSINYIYADKAGNIGMIHNAQYPNRNNEWDWSEDLPGDRSDLIWKGYRPYSQVPKLINPQSGLVFDANDSPYSATDGPDNLRPEDFPQSMGLQTNETNRSLRLIELTDGENLIGRENLLALKFDVTYAQGSEADLLVKDILSRDWSEETNLQEAAEYLREWDYSLDIDNRHAALGGLTVLREITQKYTGIPAPDAETAFREAVDYLMANHGTLEVSWGEINRLVRGDTNLPISGGPDTLRAIYPVEIREDGHLHASAGDTWIALVEWAADGTQTADIIHNFGSATLDTSSPHYDDQAQLFAREDWRRALLDDTIIRRNGRAYRPQDLAQVE